MEGLWEMLAEAHTELLNATGWGTILENLVSSWHGNNTYNNNNNNNVGILQQIYQQITAFFEAVNWSEPFFTYLAVFHAIIIIMVIILTWKASVERIFVIDIIILLLGWCSSYLNEFGRSHAADIFLEKGANYFDINGLFITVVYFFPLFLIAFILQGRIIVKVVRLMIDVKRRQLQQEMKKKKSEVTDDNSTSEGQDKKEKKNK